MADDSHTTRFDRDTAVFPAGKGRFRARMDRGWWITRGPNGGYLAAILLRAIQAGVNSPERVPRSLTVHFLAPPVEGDVDIEIRVERAGRSMTSVSARLQQGGRVIATALAALSKPFGAHDALRLRMPEVEPPELLERVTRDVPIHAQYDTRYAVGAPPFSGSSEAITGAWIRLAEPRAMDPVLLAAYSDALPPAIFPTLDSHDYTRGMPTVDLTVHFRSPTPIREMQPDDFALAVFHSHHSANGFLEEDGEIWSPSGQLLAQSRQLMVML